MKTTKSLVLGLTLFMLTAFRVCAEHAPNLLEDPSFDEGMIDTPFSSCWKIFGQVHCEAITPKSGVYAAKLYGNFKNELNWSGIYQDVPAEAGKRYVASGYLRQNTGDRLEGDNLAWIKLEFYDAGEKQIKVVETPVKLHGKSPANRFLFVSTGPATAPEGTVKARFVVIFEQPEDNTLGAMIADDVSLTEVR